MPKRLETWQLWHAMKNHLGESFLINVLGRRNGRTIRLYSQDPHFTEDRCKDPLQAMHIIFSELADYGRADVARKAIGYLKTALPEDDRLPTAVADMKATINEEVLADFSAVEALRKAIDDGQDQKEVESRTRQAVEEIERTFALYMTNKR